MTVKRAKLAFAIYFALTLAVIFVSSCATNTGDAKKDARGRAINQTLAEAGSILGRAVVSSLFNIAANEASGGRSDWQQAAVEGLYVNIDVAKSGQAVNRIVTAYSDGKAPETAKAAEKAFVEAAETQDPAKVNEAIASVVSAATGAPVPVN
jgi:antitoxin (DNA-binding transcriptional repressor) of toxin-antitoxin stability system